MSEEQFFLQIKLLVVVYKNASKKYYVVMKIKTKVTVRNSTKDAIYYTQLRQRNSIYAECTEKKLNLSCSFEPLEKNGFCLGNFSF